jgi:hypothetical protein
MCSVQNLPLPQQSETVRMRYNGIRPNYPGQRVSFVDFPDPTSAQWTFTNSCQESRVEFFEKQSGLCRVVMDFYYTTASVKTILNHPTAGVNQLFRKCRASREYFRRF